MELNGARPSAVLLLLIKEDGEEKIILEERAMTLPVQPGAICLPGGRVRCENGVLLETPKEAAVRETAEELLLSQAQILVTEALDTTLAPDGTTVYPFVGKLTGYAGTFAPAEVARVLTVPLTFFLTTEPERHIVDLVTVPRADFPYEKIPHGRDYKWVKKPQEMLFYEYEGTVIWGMTARVLYQFCKGITNDTTDL